MYAAILAFAANFLINFVLVPKLGAMGVAAGNLIGGVLAALASVYRQIGLSLRGIIIALACSGRNMRSASIYRLGNTV